MKRILSHLLILAALLLSSPGLMAQDAGGGGASLWTRLSDALIKILSGPMAAVQTVQLDGDQIGFNQLLIANVIVGVSRQVEQNPNPTSADDQYLVKDHMRLGFRLGAGLVLDGTASYIHEYTLVYPVKDHKSGLFHNRFLVDLLLPYKIHKGKLPKNYVMIYEQYIEGRARLKIDGAGIIPLGLQLHAARVRLSRTLVSQKGGGDLNIFRDRSNYSQIGIEAFEAISFINLSIFEHNLKTGKLERLVYRVPRGVLDLPQTDDAIEKFIRHDDETAIDTLAAKEKVKTEFKESYTFFSLGPILYDERIFRKDIITEHNLETGDLVQRLQVEDRKFGGWNVFFDGEDFKSKIFFTGRVVPEKDDLKDPVLRLFLGIQDFGTKKREVQEAYIPMMNEIALDPNFMSMPSDFMDGEEYSKNTFVALESHIYEEGIANLLTLSIDAYWKRLEKITGKSANYWKLAARTNYHAPEQRRLRANSRVTHVEIFLAKRLSLLSREIERARKEKKKIDQVSHLTRAIRSSIYTSIDGYRPTLIALVHEIAGAANRSISAKIERGINDQFINKVAQKTIFAEQGTRRNLDMREHNFLFIDPSEIYHIF